MKKIFLDREIEILLRGVVTAAADPADPDGFKATELLIFLMDHVPQARLNEFDRSGTSIAMAVMALPPERREQFSWWIVRPRYIELVGMRDRGVKSCGYGIYEEFLRATLAPEQAAEQIGPHDSASLGLVSKYGGPL